MNILHICNDYYGTALYKLLIGELANKGIQNEIFVSISNSSKPHKKEEHIYEVQSFNNFDRIFFFPKTRKSFHLLNEYIKNFEFDIVHAHTLFSNGYLAYKLKEKYNIPYIVAVRNTDVTVFFKKMKHLKKIGINIMRSADKIIFLSEVYKEKVIKQYVPKKLKGIIEEKSIVIPNGIDSFYLQNKTNHKEKSQEILKLTTVGEINKNKNQLGILEVCDILARKGYDIEYYIAGKVSDENIYKKVCNRSYVKYLGVLKKEELLKLYRETDIFILLSKSETFGLAYAEALTQGLPIIYTQGEGLDGYFPDGKVGFRVKYGDYSRAVESIEKILRDYESISDRAYQNCENFDWKIIAQIYYQVYSDIRQNKYKKEIK